MTMLETHREAYREESYELLAQLESSLLELEQAPRDRESIGTVFRSLHTIKGSGAMFGFDDLAAFAHELETVFDMVRSGDMEVTKTLVDLALSVKDLIREMLDPSDGSMDDLEARTREILNALGGLVSPEADAESAALPPAQPECELPGKGELTYRITFRPHPDIFKKGVNPIRLVEEIRELGPCTVLARTDAIPEIEGIDPEQCFTYWYVILTSSCGLDAIRDVFLFVEDDCELSIEIMSDFEGEVEEGSQKKLGEILIESGRVSPGEFREVLNSQKRIGEMLVDAGLVDVEGVESALAQQEHAREICKKRRSEEAASFVKAPAERLDLLVDLVGELVTVQARLSQIVGSGDFSGLPAVAEEVERLTAELRDNAMSLRMTPIGATFDRFRRLVRDLSSELGKNVVMTTEGAETELDKTVIERLNDPLVHLIRNSIDHGIEPPDKREAMGKSRAGKIRLSAEHSGSSVLIKIEDDGAGMDREAIRESAVRKGLIAPDAELSDKEAFSLIFSPGFSTASSITSVSGRGVGMDVVKRNIEALRGSIEVASSKGAGATITLKLPLTLAIIDGLLVQVGDGSFVLPLSIVEECVELRRSETTCERRRNLTYVRGEIVPYVRLRESFLIEGDPPEIEQIVITEAAEGRVGFVVDKVIGERQTVIKSLGRVYRNVEGISGATILGDGSVALILDIPQLMRRIEAEEQQTRKAVAAWRH